MSEKLRVGILGGTGMVGQRFISLLENHPWFEVVTIAASARSAGKTYEEAVGGRWKMDTPMPEAVKKIVVMNVNEVEKVAAGVDFVFSAVDMTKDEIRAIEEAYAKTETPVVSNNSAHRWTPDVPMMIPEINADHAKIIEQQKGRLGTKRGFIAVKPNCSIQSYVPALAPLYPCGIAVYDYKSGAYGFLPVDDVVEDTQAVGDTLYYTVRTGDAGHGTGNLYRLDDWDLPPTVLAEGLYVSGFIVIGDYVYYNRPSYEGETTLDEGMGGATALCRMPADGGEEQVISFDQHF